ncbi:hypothetical protein [Lysobacter sp. Root983]|uniref:hypothetical protein n=1 Tax=Lysobacter sp. Root983 TaxID=1736613 RepID=UPI00070E9368|nr:hypothetical protein [Lysobacter sp. Root983]KRD79841.1 hypothetical protein ASE43_02780 [Lysobacter sp. Root983]
MQSSLSIATFLFFIAMLVYMHAVFKFYAVVKAERPEWVDRRGSLGFFYTGIPRLADPNVSLATIGIAFSAKRHELRSPQAAKYANRVRILLPFGMVVFLGILAGLTVGAP